MYVIIRKIAPPPLTYYYYYYYYHERNHPVTEIITIGVMIMSFKEKPASQLHHIIIRHAGQLLSITSSSYEVPASQLLLLVIILRQDHINMQPYIMTTTKQNMQT
jgi:predicted class III extradiol MEMO1 family dioxygenase